MEKILSMCRSYGNPENQTVTIEVDKFNRLVECVYALADEVRGMRSLCQSSTVIYTNKTIKEVLGIQDKLLKKYRDDGLLSFHQVGDKFWYTYDDVQQFLSKHYYPAFATAS